MADIYTVLDYVLRGSNDAERYNTIYELLTLLDQVDTKSIKEKLKEWREQLSDPGNLGLTDLPFELREKIFSNLDLNTLKNVNKSLRDDVTSEILTNDLLDKLTILPYFNMRMGARDMSGYDISITGIKYGSSFTGHSYISGSLIFGENQLPVNGYVIFDDSGQITESVLYTIPLTGDSATRIEKQANLYTYVIDEGYPTEKTLIIRREKNGNVVETSGPIVTRYKVVNSPKIPGNIITVRA